MEKREYLEYCDEIHRKWSELTRVDGLKRMSIGFGEEKNHVQLFFDSFWRIAEPSKIKEIRKNVAGVDYREFYEDNQEILLVTLDPNKYKSGVIDKRTLLPKLKELNEKTSYIKEAGKINGIIAGQRFQMKEDAFFEYFPKPEYERKFHILEIDPRTRHYTLSLNGLDYTTFVFDKNIWGL